MASNNTETRNLRQIDEKTGNLYESIAIIAKRSNQIGVKIKDELNNKLSEFASSSDNLEEVFENREQIEISKHYERMPKPTLIAIEDFMEDKVYFRNPQREKKDK
jgi:DNA-directed RNA polymerase subunit K/omega